MRQDNVVKGVRSLRSLVPHLRTRLIDTPRRAAAFGLTAAVASGALMMSATHDTAVQDEMAKAAVVTTAVTERSAALASGQELATRSLDRTAAAKAAAAKVHAAKAKAKRKAGAIAARKKALAVKPVAGLNARQMRNAAIIVRAGQELGVSKRGQIVAVATAMQESNLYNLASYVVPESLKYSHEGTGADYDSVGLFQQRYTTGWGTVKSIMNPAESAKKFYRALMQVGGWQNLPVTVAAQIVQGSAFPDAYAQHTGRATMVVNAVNAHR
jgi:hypothetical protein